MPRKIIVIDDNEINRQLLIATLETDYDIIEAENGKEALRLINRHHKMLSAILTDISMPVMDGYELLQRIRENPVLSAIPVIMVTGSEDEESRVRALTLGANDFILKPFNPDIVKHCVKNNIALRETASILNAIQKDKLTGLYNREAFFSKADAAIKDYAPGFFILSCFDIDNFKLINDQFGALEGDRILREIGKTVAKDVETAGGFGGRISGDNFAVLFPSSQKDLSIIRITDKNRMAFSDKQAIIFSIGRCVVNDTSLSASAIYDRAFIAKQSVKGRYDIHIAYFDDAMLDTLIKSQKIVTEMDTAIAERQFEVWLQPQQNHSTGALVGAEALVRWRHPKRGLIPPLEFISVFEKNGFIYELDKYVWEETCRLLRKWMDEGKDPIPVSVNVSRIDIFRTDFIEIITGLIEKYNIPISLLRLEITESAFVHSTEKIVEIVKQLVDLGFTIEIDDFGSGYSSLNTLKCVPAQVVKLDMHFLENDDNSGRGGNILESIVRMTKWLGISVIAEGVEEKVQADYLSSIGCSYIQGYLYARPMLVSEYEEYCESIDKEEHLLSMETVANLDNNSFWNPKSMDTLIFNSYVGAACIFEYNDGNIEILRANSKFTSILSDGTMSVEDTLKLDWLSCLTPEGLTTVRNILKQSAENGEEYTAEYEFHNITGAQEKTYLRSTMRAIAKAGKRTLVYCASENITLQKEAEQSTRAASEQIETMIHDMPGGYARLRIHSDGRLTYIYFNDAYCQMRGMTREDVMGFEDTNALKSVHPDDIANIKIAINATLACENTATFKYRLVCGNGEYKWISAVGRKTFEKSGAAVINIYYTDIDAQTKEEETQKELLDNLPCGAGIYEFKDGQMQFVYQNKSYWELVGLGDEAFPDPNEMSAIHPDDIALVMQSLSAALEQNTNVLCDIRLRHLTKEYIFVHLFGRIVPLANGGFYIYATFTPISDETLSVQKMLPVAIQAIMDSSSEVAFIKDRNLKYISCSERFASLAGAENKNDLLGKCTSDVFDSDFATLNNIVDREILQSKQSYVDKDIILTAKNGSIHLLFSKYPLLDSTGNVLGIYGTGRDITEARRQQSRFELLTNNILGGIAIYEGKPDELDKIRLSYFSDGFCSLFGYTRKEYEKLAAVNPLGLVFSADISKMFDRIIRLIKDDVPMDFTYRATVNGGKIKFINVKAVMGEPNGDNLTVNALFFDVTEQRNAEERLRVSEEINRLAILQSESMVCKFDISSGKLSLSENANPIFNISPFEDDVPEKYLRDGRVSPETADAYMSFFKSIINGEKRCKGLFQIKSTEGWSWIEAKSTTIFTDEGKPSTAVISFLDVTESIERNMAYQKWKQSLTDKLLDSYSLFHCNITKDSILSTIEGLLIPLGTHKNQSVFSQRTADYAEECVFSEDRNRFLSVLDRGFVLLRYRQGRKSDLLEYREQMTDGRLRWIRLTVDLIQPPLSDDIEAYLMFEDIDEAKKAELDILERAETDSLTGLLNRKTFESKFARRIATRSSSELSALFIIDLDSFKSVNDTFGHAVGDETLIEFAAKLRTVFRGHDLIARLGGDEFLIYISRVPNLDVINEKASLICASLHKSFSIEVQLSSSVGIAVCPNDGLDFETLYKKADMALYHVKETGKNSYALYNETMCEKLAFIEDETDGSDFASDTHLLPKRRMLIVDDNEINRDYLSNLFSNEFIIDTAPEGTAALVKLHRYGAAISVVLLDITIPGIDGFSVLKKMRENLIMQSIPVIVVSGIDEKSACLKAIKGGASDYITKPVDADLLKLRVAAALSRAENEHLRAANRYLALKNDEAKRLADSKRHAKELSIALHAAERADLAKGQFLSSMSHEIRTPLNAVIGYNTIAKNEMIKARSDEEKRHVAMKVMDCLTKSEIASRHLLTIINDVLDMSAIESGKMKVEHLPFDFKNIITSLTVMFFAQARSKGVNFDVLFDKPIEEWFIGDQLRINQILTNLLSNAVKFTPENGKVTMTITEKNIDDETTDFCFTVSDTGIGMTKEYLSHIWTPFEQEEASISQRFGGTGLGLSITKNLVEMMDGSISVESESGIGTTFTVQITLRRTTQPDKSTGYDFSDVNALIVDDDINTCDYIKLLFNRCGAHCLTATSGKQAIEVFAAAKKSENPFNVCLIDWHMPQTDGIATINEIRRISAKELPIVVVTAYDFSEISDQAEKLGINSFISKPLFQSSLYDLLANISGNRAILSTKANPKYDFDGARVLLAEDNNMNMEVAKHLLLSVGIAVDGACNGQEAVDIFTASRSGTYKAILMDIHMPVIDGYQATQLIRSSGHADALCIPIIAMTADAFAEDIAEAHSVGMNDHISKPIDVDTMYKILKKYTKGSKK